MATYGRYETVQELHSIAGSSISAARLAGTQDPPAFAIKVFRPMAHIVGPEQARQQARQFLDQARAQKDLAESNPTAWPAMHELGTAGGECFCVSDLYARSAEDLVRSKARLSSRQLHRLASAIIAALLHIRDHAKRPHGNLKPANVLIKGDRIESAAVVLSDPLPADSLPKHGREWIDLLALGQVLRALVTHETRADAGLGPGDPAAWKRLGPAGPSWRDLCERLLQADAGDGPLTLEDVAAEVAQLGRGRSRAPLLVGGAIVGALALAIAGWAMFSHFNASEPEAISTDFRRLCSEYALWAGDVLEKNAANLKSASRQDIDPNEIWKQFNNGKPYGNGDEIQRLSHVTVMSAKMLDSGVKPALKKLNALREEIESHRRGAQELRDRFDQHGWSSSREAIDRVLRGPSLPDNAKVDQVVTDQKFDLEGQEVRNEAAAWAEAVKSIVNDVPELKSAVDELESHLPVLRQGDDIVGRFEVALRKELDRDFSGPADIRERLREPIKVATLTADIIQRRWVTTIDQDYFKEQSDIWKDYKREGASEGAVTLAMVSRWAREVLDERFTKLSDQEDPRVFARGKRRPRELIEEWRLVNDAATSLPPDQAHEFRGRLSSLQGTIETVSRAPWKRATKDSLESQVATIDAELSLINSEVAVKRGCDPTETRDAYVQRVAQDNPFASDAVRQKWIAARDQILSANSENPCPQVEEVRRILQAIDGLPSDFKFDRRPDDVTEESLRKAGQAVRERLTAEILSSADWHEGWQDKVRELKERLQAWTSRSADFLVVAMRVQEMLDRCDGLQSQANKVLIDNFRTDDRYPDVAAALSSLSARVVELERIEAKNGVDDELIDWAKTGRPSTRLAAWRKLGDLGWPSNVASLEQEVAIRTEVRLAIKSLNDAARRAELEAGLAQEGPLRWQRCFAALANEPEPKHEALKRAADLRQEFGVDDQTLTPWQQFNLKLVLFRNDLNGKTTNDNAAVAERALGFLADIQSLMSSASSVQALRVAIDEHIAKSNGPQGPALSEIGPAKVKGWRLQTVEGEGDVVRYAREGGDPQSLTFVRIKAASTDGKDAYICATEMSVGLFADLLGAANLWPALETAWPSLTQDRKQKNEPRSWTYSKAAKMSPSNNAWIVATDVWQQDFDSATTHWRGKPATRDHPVNAVPPFAAMLAARILNCRLPTSEEWLAAYQLAARGADDGSFIDRTRPNLRDETWLAYYKFVSDFGRTGLLIELPSKGIFPGPDGSAVPAIYKSSGGQAYNDGYLWFEPVSREAPLPPTELQHLIGNVAELTFELPQDSEKIIIDDTFKVVMMKEALGPLNRFGVIGGSALSSPENPRTQRQPLALSGSPWIGYTDVGFRLAFTAGAGKPYDLADQVVKLLTPQTYLRGDIGGDRPEG